MSGGCAEMCGWQVSRGGRDCSATDDITTPGSGQALDPALTSLCDNEADEPCPNYPKSKLIARGVDERDARRPYRKYTWFSEKPEPFKSTPTNGWPKELPGQRIERVYRVGKHIVFDLSKNPGIAVDCAPGHDRPLCWWPIPATPIPLRTPTAFCTWILGQRATLCRSRRRFGRMALHVTQFSRHRPLSRFDHYVRRRFCCALPPSPHPHQSRSAQPEAVCTALATSMPMRACFAPEFAPAAWPRHLKRALNWTVLHASPAEAFCREAISLGGSSVSDYVDAAGVAGFFQLEHRVYMRTGQPCLVCGTPDPSHTASAGRGTHFCAQCQH